jgi:hypothetical protein
VKRAAKRLAAHVKRMMLAKFTMIVPGSRTQKEKSKVGCLVHHLFGREILFLYVRKIKLVTCLTSSLISLAEMLKVILRKYFQMLRMQTGT